MEQQSTQHDDRELNASESGREASTSSTKRSAPLNAQGTVNSQGKVVNIRTQQQLNVHLMDPKSFEDVQEATLQLRSGKPVVVNMSEIEKELAQRLLDFISGSVFALDGQIQKVGHMIYLLTPSNVGITGDHRNEETRSRGYQFAWMRG
jgi:cell division inhibitor SepF